MGLRLNQYELSLLYSTFYYIASSNLNLHDLKRFIKSTKLNIKAQILRTIELQYFLTY